MSIKLPRPCIVLLLAALTTGLAWSSTSHAANGYVDAQVVVRLTAGHAIGELFEPYETTLLDQIAGENLYLLEYLGEENLYDMVDSLRSDPAVTMAELNYYRETPESIRQMVISSTGLTFEDYADQAITTRIGLGEAHALANGQDILVAVLDSGIDTAHDAFAGRLAPGYDFVDDDADPSEEQNGYDDDQDGQMDEGFGHGTMVAGIVALVAPGATILPLRVLNDEGRSHAFVIAKAIRHARTLGADVINMSFGAPTPSASINSQVIAAYDDGIIMVAGAGNENDDDAPYHPGALEQTIMVTALDSSDVKADFADWNAEVDVSAPGVAVASAYPGNEYASASGCSFATPIVSGEVALVLDLAPWISPGAMKDMIQGAVDPIYQIPENYAFLGYLGTGRIYLPQAVSATTSAPDPSFHAGLLAAPNPAHGRVTFWAPALPAEKLLTLRVFDAAGRVVRMLEGQGSAVWDGLDERRVPVPSGVYFVRWMDDPRTATRIVWAR